MESDPDRWAPAAGPGRPGWVRCLGALRPSSDEVEADVGVVGDGIPDAWERALGRAAAQPPVDGEEGTDQSRVPPNTMKRSTSRPPTERVTMTPHTRSVDAASASVITMRASFDVVEGGGTTEQEEMP